jgi:T3SS (YopN, CesT) and YbjN peptide-binding chaperone 1
MNAVATSCASIEKALGKSPAYRKVDDLLYVVKQGSSYVMISVVPSGAKGKENERALVRVVAQVVAGVTPEPSLFRQLLILNGQLRFGSFAYVPEGNLIMFGHSILGGDTMDTRELVSAVHDVALVADEYDDRIVARYGGARMQDVIEEKAMAHLFGDAKSEEDL